MPTVPDGACVVPITGGTRWEPVIQAWALVSAEDYDTIAEYRWGMTAAGYARRALPRNGRRPKFIYMHRVILPGAHAHVDHVNGNKLDNRRENLRPATPSENLANSRRRNESGYRGVSEDKRRGTYTGRVKKGSRVWCKSGFLTPEAAAEWRDGIAAEVQGEFFMPSRQVDLRAR
jgi:hypothetical protein